ARIQVEGGIVMGIGLGLYEEVRYSSKGRLATDSFMNYNMPTRQDIRDIEVIFESSHEPSHHLGAKSVGEVVINTPPPAIAQAVYNATGVRIRSLPVTAEKVLLGRMENEQSTTISENFQNYRN
ncbi:MAG: aldehyde oxidase, partial [Acidobacteria bacterium]